MLMQAQAINRSPYRFAASYVVVIVETTPLLEVRVLTFRANRSVGSRLSPRFASS